MFEKVKTWFDQLVAKVTGKKPQPAKPAMVTTVAAQYEINLVPEVKMRMIKAQKTRNLVLFICIVVSAVSIGVVLILFGIKSGQDIAMSNQDKKLETMSEKLLGYDELGDLVTIQSQLSKLAEITGQKKVLSRVFGAMGVMLPQGEDVVQLSELRVDLDNNTVRMEAQADARVAPLIDYRVLESFKKGVALTKYDYGRFVDANGTEIPTWCINEADENGNAYKDGESYYAWWDLNANGCKAVARGTAVSEEADVSLYYNPESEVEATEEEVAVEELQNEGKVSVAEDGTVTVTDNAIEVRQGEDGSTHYIRKTVNRVKIWRTPQFTKWLNGGLMELDGRIDGIEHFNSACINYSGTMVAGSAAARWTSTNDCMLAPEGLTVVSSSNGRDDSDNLVLKFTASAQIDPEFFAFKNKHMIAIGPMGQNVTDSYVQIGGMFTREARECEEGDTECLNNANNTGETNNGGQ